MTLIEFLLARIAEDEALTRTSRLVGQRYPMDDWGPDRVLAECGAKRLAVRFLGDLERGEFGDSMTSSIAYSTLCRMAQVYADHPDYRQEWKL